MYEKLEELTAAMVSACTDIRQFVNILQTNDPVTGIYDSAFTRNQAIQASEELKRVLPLLMGELQALDVTSSLFRIERGSHMITGFLTWDHCKRYRVQSGPGDELLAIGGLWKEYGNEIIEHIRDETQ